MFIGTKHACSRSYGNKKPSKQITKKGKTLTKSPDAKNLSHGHAGPLNRNKLWKYTRYLRKESKQPPIDNAKPKSQ